MKTTLKTRIIQALAIAAMPAVLGTLFASTTWGKSHLPTNTPIVASEDGPGLGGGYACDDGPGLGGGYACNDDGPGLGGGY